MAKEKDSYRGIGTQAPEPIESLRGIPAKRKPKKIDQQLWPRAGHWSIKEAAHLLCGINPGFYELPLEYPDRSFEEDINRTYELLKRSYEIGELKSIRLGYSVFAPRDIIEWAKKKGLEVPSELRNILFDFSEDKDIDGLVSDLRVSDENDSEVLIQVPGKKVKSVTWEDLGFQSELSETWKVFQDIIQEPNHTFDLGQSRTLDYGKKHKQLNGISKKLIKYLNKEYSLNIPQDFKMFERDKAQKTGVPERVAMMISGHKTRSVFDRYNSAPKRKMAPLSPVI